VATAAAAGAADPLAVAAAADGHPENAAASVRGGLVAATTVAGMPVAAPLPLDPDLAFVVLVPSRTLPTSQARQALPATVSHRDAAFNLGRMGLLVSGLADRRHLVRAATEDRLHQAARSPLFPEASQLLGRLVDAGALAASWSGAGPSLIGFCDRQAAPRVRDAGELMLKELSVPGRAMLLDADRRGLLVARGSSPPPGGSESHRWP
jgi:homoserine kinase